MYTKYVKLRDSKGVKDLDVSKATGIAPSTLSDWKSGKYTPKVEKIKALADYFNVSIEYFLKEG